LLLCSGLCSLLPCLLLYRNIVVVVNRGRWLLGPALPVGVLLGPLLPDALYDLCAVRTDTYRSKHRTLWLSILYYKSYRFL